MTGVIWSLAALWAGIIAMGAFALRRMAIRSRIRERLRTFDADEIESTADERGGWLRRWLFLAGFRSRGAVPLFLAATLVGVMAGLGIAAAVKSAGIVALLDSLLRSVPGNVGEIFLPFAWLSPWISCVMLASFPTLVVRSRRRRRVTQIEQDLPMTLDLLATLAQAGLGFDAALERVLAAMRAERPLAQEFRIFQYDLLAGRPRVEALRRLSRRVEVTWFTIFISAVVQAEQIGAGLAGVLETQADDLRQRRRERALAFAMAVPVKLVFPLIVCFLPGIFVAAVGPMIFQIVQTLDSFLRPMTGGGG